ncbi:MAG: hypothetical protein ACI87O_000218 [Planctomycetota bacterium]|jgi:hypothetical protein
MLRTKPDPSRIFQPTHFANLNPLARGSLEQDFRDQCNAFTGP